MTLRDAGAVILAVKVKHFYDKNVRRKANGALDRLIHMARNANSGS